MFIPTDELSVKQKNCTNMNKYLVYTSNLPEMPKDMKDVITFAQNEPKFYISSVELNGCLSEVKEGDQIFTKRGNSLYVIRCIKSDIETLNEEDREYLETLKREYGLRNVNITSVSQIVKFETWCKSAKPILTTKSNKAMSEKSTLKGSMFTRIKEMFYPEKAENIRISTNGELAVETEAGFVAINNDNELVSYPRELTLDFPVYLVSKPKEQVVEGDVIVAGRSYAKVTKVDGSKITAISYTGTGKSIHTVKDFLFNQSMVRVAVSMSGMAGGQINPMMLLALSREDGDNSLKDMLPLMMMSQNGGNLGMNPMMAYALLGEDSGKSSIKDLLMMSMMSNGNFGNLFGGCCNNVTEKKASPVRSVSKKKKVTKKPETEVAE